MRALGAIAGLSELHGRQHRIPLTDWRASGRTLADNRLVAIDHLLASRARCILASGEEDTRSLYQILSGLEIHTGNVRHKCDFVVGCSRRHSRWWDDSRRHDG